jgi:hypothetical protein
MIYVYQTRDICEIMAGSSENIKMQQLTIKLKVDDLNKLREYADTKGGNPVSHYIREAVSEFLENKLEIIL